MGALLFLFLKPAAAQEVKNGQPESTVEAFSKMKIRSVTIVPKKLPEISYHDFRVELSNRGISTLLQDHYVQANVDQAAALVREMYKARYSQDVEVTSWAKRINPRFVRLEFRVKLAHP